jgi:anti-sigma factor RsiW
MALNEDEKAELVAYLDGELDEAATQAVEAKIATDADARAELDALKQTWGMLDYLPKASPSPNFTNRTLERLTLEKVGGPARHTMVVTGRRSSWLVTACWAAALVLAIGVGYFGATQLLSVTTTPEPIPDADRDLMRHLRVAEKWHLYENADDLEFVKKLDHPDLFGEDPS